MFKKANAYFVVTIDNHVILYWDKKEGALWGGSLQYLPPDPASRMKIINSRNKIPAYFLDLLKVSEDELKEFETAKTDEELKKLVIRDAKLHYCELMSEETK